MGGWLPGYEVHTVRHVEEHDVDERRRDAGRVAVNTGDLFGEVPPGRFVEKPLGADALVEGMVSPKMSAPLTVSAVGSVFIVSRGRTIGSVSCAQYDAA